MSSNDFNDFFISSAKIISDEYNRIQKRATADPGTAGDQGEENWAKLLRNWLPEYFHIVTKGRILYNSGYASPQVDVILLQPEYPKDLLDKKLYYAGGVLAAFECKVTLKSEHLKDFVRKSVDIKSNNLRKLGTPYNELQSSIIYGLLAHSHSWKGANSKPLDNIVNKLKDEDRLLINHPMFMPDVLCVADLACWVSNKLIYVNNDSNVSGESINKIVVNSTYIQISPEMNNSNPFSPIAPLITNLLYKLAWEYSTLRRLSTHFRLSGGFGSGAGKSRSWDGRVFSESVRRQIISGGLRGSFNWDEWDCNYF